jgi:hypothetical protein
MLFVVRYFFVYFLVYMCTFTVMCKNTKVKVKVKVFKNVVHVVRVMCYLFIFLYIHVHTFTVMCKNVVFTIPSQETKKQIAQVVLLFLVF